MKLNNNPECLLFAQHGWADTGKNIGKLIESAVDERTKRIVPSLGLLKTFIRLKPLVEQLEQIAREEINQNPHLPIKIVGHSMGGLLWLEVLDRNPQWWSKIHSLILLGSPVGGSNIARVIDPFSWGIGTAADLGRNRRLMASKIARQVPTLSVASDIGMGTDGLVTVENTKFDYSNWVLISDVPHSAMRHDSRMIPIMQRFWENPQLGSTSVGSLSEQLIQRLRDVPGMTDDDHAHFQRSPIIAHLPEALTLHHEKNLWGVDRVYLGHQQKCLYAGYVGLVHVLGLRQTLRKIQTEAIKKE
ncbi:MAG: lysophospholipase [Cyanobacteria bacterium J06600_6]